MVPTIVLPDMPHMPPNHTILPVQGERIITILGSRYTGCLGAWPVAGSENPQGHSSLSVVPGSSQQSVDHQQIRPASGLKSWDSPNLQSQSSRELWPLQFKPWGCPDLSSAGRKHPGTGILGQGWPQDLKCRATPYRCQAQSKCQSLLVPAWNAIC